MVISTTVTTFLDYKFRFPLRLHFEKHSLRGKTEEQEHVLYGTFFFCECTDSGFLRFFFGYALIFIQVKMTWVNYQQ